MESGLSSLSEVQEGANDMMMSATGGSPPSLWPTSIGASSASSSFHQRYASASASTSAGTATSNHYFPSSQHTFGVRPNPQTSAMQRPSPTQTAAIPIMNKQTFHGLAPQQRSQQVSQAFPNNRLVDADEDDSSDDVNGDDAMMADSGNMRRIRSSPSDLSSLMRGHSPTQSFQPPQLGQNLRRQPSAPSSLSSASHAQHNSPPLHPPLHGHSPPNAVLHGPAGLSPTHPAFANPSSRVTISAASTLLHHNLPRSASSTSAATALSLAGSSPPTAAIPIPILHAQTSRGHSHSLSSSPTNARFASATASFAPPSLTQISGSGRRSRGKNSPLSTSPPGPGAIAARAIVHPSPHTSPVLVSHATVAVPPLATLAPPSPVMPAMALQTTAGLPPPDLHAVPVNPLNSMQMNDLDGMRRIKSSPVSLSSLNQSPLAAHVAMEHRQPVSLQFNSVNHAHNSNAMHTSSTTIGMTSGRPTLSYAQGRGRKVGSATDLSSLQQSKKQRRLARKAEAARASRRRKKAYLLALEEKVSALSTKLAQLQAGENAFSELSAVDLAHRKEQQVVKKQMKQVVEQMQNAENDMDGVTDTTHAQHADRKNESAASPISPTPTTSPSGSSSLMDELKSLLLTFIGNSRRRQSASDHHLVSMEALLIPPTLVKFILWMLSQNDEFYGPAGMWHRIMTQEMACKSEQLEQIIALRGRVKDFRHSLQSTRNQLLRVREHIQHHLAARQQQIDSITSILTPVQLAQFIVNADEYSQRSPNAMQEALMTAIQARTLTSSVSGIQ